MTGRIDIAMGFDARYTTHAANVMTSIVRHAPGAKLRFIVLQTDVKDAERRRIEAAVGAAEVVWVEVGEADLPAHATRGHLSRAMLFRLGLETLAPQDCARVIYVDADTIVLGDVRELWEADLGDAPIGAVTDCYQVADKFAEAWSLPRGGRYFNSGVLLIDLAKVRAGKLFSRALAFVVEHDDKLLFSDQDALNHVFWKNAAVLEPTWNVQRYLSRDEITGETAPDRRWGQPSPRLVHYIGTEKPWMKNVWHPWAWLYWENLRRTPFAADVKRASGMGFLQMMRLRLRWWIKRPGKVQMGPAPRL